MRSPPQVPSSARQCRPARSSSPTAPRACAHTARRARPVRSSGCQGAPESLPAPVRHGPASRPATQTARTSPRHPERRP
ncbi:hypothetical protein G6F63_015096 [Rhizopus arrhizus]|nr:hypothetical protein G6F63_015096 [Rhizopus arrhizus]